MGSISGEDSKSWGEQEQDAQGEKIFVAVRLRPLNEKEIAKNDTSDWECINNNTIIFRNTLPERSLYPVAYTLDRVYGCDSSTRQVYEEAAKKIALSVINGINASIFAYGQTSSGKTYTMSGVTEYAMADIFDQISKQNNREFVLKFSAIEIYNECVRDLLSTDNAPLRLLDDPEKGTVIEKLTEVKLGDWSHLKELLSICEAERQIGETTLNEMSSRSHQILRLTVESSAREFQGHDNASTLAATVNFVDLAGSERASQTLSAGTRLKEGCHINRSLLTLGTVVRKLSKGRNGHIPYRDSKLTRILQHALGGNARTAIICTMSPAHTHVEQSRNTLLFAISAKEISTNAQVNVVMSEKALVKQLQRELARLENEIKILSASSDSAAIIREKELQIQKMEKEIQELTRQRDIAESRLEEIIRIAGIDQNSLPWVDSIHLPRHRDHSSWDGYPTLDTSEVEPRHLSRRHQQTSWDGHLLPDTSEAADPIRFDYSLNTYRFPDKQGPQTSDDDQYFFDNISPSQFMNQYFGPDPCQGWEKIDQKPATTYSEESCKEVRCIEKSSSIDSNVSAEKVRTVDALDSPKQKNEEIHAIIDDYDKPYYVEPSPCSSDTDLSDSRSINLTRSRSCRAIITTSSSPASEKEVVTESITNNGLEREVSGRQERHRRTISVSKSEANIEKLNRQDSQKSVETLEEEELEQTVKSKQNPKPKQAIRSKSEANMAKISRQDSLDSIKFVGKKDMEQNINSATEEDIFDLSPTAKSCSKGVKFDNEIVKLAKSNTDKNDNLDDRDWPSMFEKQRRNIIELWNACNIPLLHRTYFFLLFKGDPSDSVYMEVELRRLSFLKKTVSPSSSARSLNRERMMLSKKLQKKFSAKEREAIFVKWGINLESKNRRVQLSHLLWSKTDDIEHATASAEIVAKLVGLLEPNQTPKELFALSFAPKEDAIRSSIWRNSMSFNR